MGGRGSGGGRPGTGPKPVEDLVEAKPVAAPDGMSEAEMGVWNDLAPKAVQRGTLTDETSARFCLLCRAVVMERQLADKIAEKGVGSDDALKLYGPHRGMMQRVEAGMAAFRIAPVGKPLVVAKEKAQSALERLQARRLRAV